MATRSWKNPEDQRAAAQQFLLKTLTDPGVREKVLADRKAAREVFASAGEIEVPDDVEVICVDHTTQGKARVVVFSLPDPTSPIDPPPNPLRHWIAGWLPYDETEGDGEPL